MLSVADSGHRLPGRSQVTLPHKNQLTRRRTELAEEKIRGRAPETLGQARKPDLHDRVAVVTGGASGIGRATALLLAANGARVFVGDFDLLAENESVFAQAGISQTPCDVRREDQVEGLIDRAAREGGRLDILVNSAGVGLVKQITEVTEEEWDACLDTNLKG